MEERRQFRVLRLSSGASGGKSLAKISDSFVGSGVSLGALVVFGLASYVFAECGNLLECTALFFHLQQYVLQDIIMKIVGREIREGLKKGVTNKMNEKLKKQQTDKLNGNC